MTTGWLAYDPARMATLAHRTIEAADYFDRITSDEPMADSAILTIRAVSFKLRTTWLPTLSRISGDTSLTAWLSGGPGAMSGWGELAPPSDPDDPAAVSDWWTSLPGEQQLEYIAGAPAAIGNLDGVPAWARDEANRLTLEHDLEALEAKEAADTLTDDEAAVLANARAIQDSITEAEQFVDPVTGVPVVVQLYIYEPAAFDGDGRAAISIGDLDTAANVAVTVPGLGTEMTHIGTSVQQNIYTDAREEYPEPDETVAVLAWSGYDAPSIEVPDGTAPDADDLTDIIVEAVDLFGVATMGKAHDGAALLAEDVAGINAMRRTDAHVTVIGNSYGSTTVAIAADEFGLEAADVVLTGSPEAGNADSAADLITGTENTWVASASNDPVTYLGETGGSDPLDLAEPLELVTGTEFGLGNDPSEDDFGAQRFQAEWSGRDHGGWTFAAHSHYYDVNSESNENIASIVMGHPDDVELAEHRHKEEDLNFLEIAQAIATLDVGVAFPEDPEEDRPLNEHVTGGGTGSW